MFGAPTEGKEKQFFTVSHFDNQLLACRTTVSGLK
jgi:hypothetical protein